MARLQTFPSISAGDLYAVLMRHEEIAVIDVREARFYAQGHINLSVHSALSSLELQVLRSVPRPQVCVVLVDDDGAVGGRTGNVSAGGAVMKRMPIFFNASQVLTRSSLRKATC